MTDTFPADWLEQPVREETLRAMARSEIVRMVSRNSAVIEADARAWLNANVGETPRYTYMYLHQVDEQDFGKPYVAEGTFHRLNYAIKAYPVFQMAQSQQTVVCWDLFDADGNLVFSGATNGIP